MMEGRTPAERYYLDGYMKVPLAPNAPATARLGQVLNHLLVTDTLPSPFFWEPQGDGSFAMRPNVFEYDSVFLDVLFENHLPQLLEQVTHRNLTLFHIQAVRTQPGPSYVDWHRDTHFYDGEKVAGNLPPVHKFIFYPQRPQAPAEQRLKVLKGSHRVMFTNRELDFSLIQAYPTEVVETSNAEILLFETTTFHAVVPDSHPGGSIRAIYSFAHQSQLEKHYIHKPIHSELNRLFRERLERAQAQQPVRAISTHAIPPMP